MEKSNYPSKSEYHKLSMRPQLNTDELAYTVKEIFKIIRKKGDLGIKELSIKYDNVDVDKIRVSPEEIESACANVPEGLKKAIGVAKKNITTFHQAQLEANLPIIVTTQKGVSCKQACFPIDNIGLYIPGGTAPLFSSVLMLAVPAILAGCSRIVICTPPEKDGGINSAIAYTAQLCGVKEIYKIGGAQAIAAMALGTRTISKVDKIFGPGNQYVTAAKSYAFQLGVGIDMPAGPSELLVFADESCRPEFVASDLLSQAEHGTDSQVVLVSDKASVIDKVEDAIIVQLEKLPRRDIATEALKNCKMILVKNVDNAFEFINYYAPEHLIIASDKSELYATYVRNAGSVFLGHFTPESAGDYASGTNHTLPTGMAAKAFSGVNIDSFIKKITFQQITEEGLRDLSTTITTMARAEKLEAHANAVDIRFKQKK